MCTLRGVNILYYFAFEVFINFNLLALKTKSTKIGEQATLYLLGWPHVDRYLCPPQPSPSNVIKQAAPLDSTNQSTEPFILPPGAAGRP